MKPKVFIKKLVLNKKTIVDLNNKAMKDVVGGWPQTSACRSYSDWPIMCPFTYCECQYQLNFFIYSRYLPIFDRYLSRFFSAWCKKDLKETPSH